MPQADWFTANAPEQPKADWFSANAPEPDFRTTNAKDAAGDAEVDPNTAGTFLSHLGAQINPLAAVQSVGKALIPEAAARAMGATDEQARTYGPLNTVKQIGAAQGALFDKAKAAYNQGDYLTAARHFVDYLLPIVGPALDQSADQMQAGKYAAGAGDAVGLGLAMFGPEAVSKAAAGVKLQTRGVVKPSLTAKEAAANQFAEQRGIPLDAATATGSKTARAIEKLVANSMGGEGTADALIAKQQQALGRVGGDLATDARATPSTPETAGQGIADALKSKLDAHHALEQQSYAKVERFAAQRNLTVPTGPVKTMLKPLYEGLQREGQLAPLMGGKAEALRALDRFMSAPDAVPLMDAESALSALKDLSRLKDGQQTAMRTPGQAAAGLAVRELQKAVDASAARGGVMRDLQTGRAATAAKFDTSAVLDSLNGPEPVGFFKQVTRAKDASIDRLRTVAKQAPQAMPQIARAYLEDLLGQATERGRFDHADKLYAEWQKLGPETKRTLFPKQGQVEALDHFFLTAKRIAENPNPSGTAHTLTAVNFGAIPVTYALSKLLYTPAGVRTLTQGLKFSLGGNKTAALAEFTRAAELLKAATPETAPRLAIPALAGTPTSPEPR